MWFVEKSLVRTSLGLCKVRGKVWYFLPPPLKNVKEWVFNGVEG